MYKEIIRPLLDRLDSETWHDRAREALHLSEISPVTLKILELFADRGRRYKNERLKVILGGIEFENPVMVGAGWDKEGIAVKGLFHLGFSGVEVGTVTQYPQEGNKKPRQFVLGPGTILNRLGFNNLGMNAVAGNLEKYAKSRIPIGISIGINKDIPAKFAPDGYAEVAGRLYDYASYFAINVSSPNTPHLRELQNKKALTDIVQAVQTRMKDLGEVLPLFVKIDPDLNVKTVDDVIRVVVDNSLTGIIATNTTVNPDIKAKYGARWAAEYGGVSGDDPDFRRMATEKIAHIYKETAGRVEIIGVGGIKNTESAWEKISAGAKIVQVVTAIRGEGPGVAGKINRGLIERMDKEGIKNIGEVIGSSY
jgi:dihydroorotate dehydrogenase